MLKEERSQLEQGAGGGGGVVKSREAWREGLSVAQGQSETVTIP